ncbi:unknown protein [Microcystis aeruginosa NIES-843]|uniref:Uncharacterized protein n=1 Tax=Microcystis aeruginosa (strain NIES-843 / IAM M-2473) TaxID=449447 RepID=B0JNA4_MICAN|nr:unknown protein [Microcystis aeruginosa NIES-843]
MCRICPFVRLFYHKIPLFWGLRRHSNFCRKSLPSFQPDLDTLWTICHNIVM